MTYKVVAILWQDHYTVSREELPNDPDSALLTPTLSFGIIVKETDKTILLVSDIERYSDRDEATYLLILKSTIEGIQTYGEIVVENLRFAP